MKMIINKNLGGEKVYNVGVIIAISGAFLGAAAVMMATYNLMIVRYCIIAVALVVIFIKRQQIISVVKEVRNKK